jgi:hypothetical protein
MFYKFLFLLILLTTNCVSFSEKINPDTNSYYPVKTDSKVKSYFNNRLMDLRDIFSINLIYGFQGGIKADISKIGVGVYFATGSVGHGMTLSEEIGLRGGEVGSHSNSDGTLILNFSEKFIPSDGSKMGRSESRNKTIDKNNPDNKNPAHWTRLGVTLGLLVGVRVEFNLGELADFFAGLFGADLYKDDVYK